ncbi:MAG: DUF393 domain-containing protein [Marinibacterium sp.]|nr:DUF393 domain-containing protein [Marinibacterium sp.]
MAQHDDTRVLYNHDCPVCRFEITHYADYARDRGLPVRFEDLNGDTLRQWGLTRDQAARRLHVLKDGQILSGIDGFLVIWADMPRYRWMARVVGLPGIRQGATALYDHVLAPAIYRWDRWRQNRRKVSL